MRRHIKYRAEYKHEKHKVEIRITEQTHRGIDFSVPHRNSFFHEGYELCSAYGPASGYNLMWMLGRGTETDNDSVLVTPEQYQKFKAAVLAYNETFKGGDDD